MKQFYPLKMILNHKLHNQRSLINFGINLNIIDSSNRGFQRMNGLLSVFFCETKVYLNQNFSVISYHEKIHLDKLAAGC